jgi:methoxymalonate biosynthesis acyl carrier protein
MEYDEIIRELRHFVQERFKVPENDPDFSDDVHLFDYGYVDSFGAVELTSFVKGRYSVEVTGSDLIAFPLNTIRDIASFVLKRSNGEI